MGKQVPIVVSNPELERKRKEEKKETFRRVQVVKHQSKAQDNNVEISHVRQTFSIPQASPSYFISQITSIPFSEEWCSDVRI
jgi:mRNA degradation ribonuclease J1/J2